MIRHHFGDFVFLVLERQFESQKKFEHKGTRQPSSQIQNISRKWHKWPPKFEQICNSFPKFLIYLMRFVNFNSICNVITKFLICSMWSVHYCKYLSWIWINRRITLNIFIYFRIILNIYLKFQRPCWINQKFREVIAYWLKFRDEHYTLSQCI